MAQLKFDFLFAGNYLTTMIGALELANAGKKVAIINPLPGWGGHFTKVNINGLNFDPGAISHEFTAFNDTGIIDPISYQPNVRNDWGRFTKVIENYTRSHIELVKMQTPFTVYDGQLYPDIIMTNRLDVLQHPIIKNKIKAETALITSQPENELHPSSKKTNELYIKRSYYEASVANHGATLHSELFEPYFQKMSNLSTTDLIALYHRIGWLPMYYPETLLSQYGNSPQNFHDTYFCYPKAGYVGVFGETLLKRLEEVGVTLIRDGFDRVVDNKGSSTVYMKNGDEISAPKLIWSLSHDQLVSNVTGKPANVFDRWSATLVFMTIPANKLKKEFSVLWSPDRDTLFYRASNLTASAGMDEANARIGVELNPDYLALKGLTTETEITARVKQDFCSLGFVEDAADFKIEGFKTLKNVLLLPNSHNWKLLENERDVLYNQYPNVYFTRNTESFFTDTLNDQIIKGLKIAAQFKNA